MAPLSINLIHIKLFLSQNTSIEKPSTNDIRKSVDQSLENSQLRVDIDKITLLPNRITFKE